MTNTIRTYTELCQIKTFEERFAYLKLDGVVGANTFGLDRYLNQIFYNSKEWRRIRDEIIIRDKACDLGIRDLEIFSGIIIHHMNPMLVNDLIEFNPDILNPEFLICTSLNTHNGIHFGNKNSTMHLPRERKKGDTSPWKVY